MASDADPQGIPEAPSLGGDGGRSPVAKRRGGKHAVRGSRFCITYFGRKGDQPVEDPERPGDGSPPASPREKDREESQEGASVDGSPGRSPSPLQRGDGRDRPHLPDVLQKAERLGAELREVLLSDKQVSKCEFIQCCCPFELSFAPSFCLLHSF